MVFTELLYKAQIVLHAYPPYNILAKHAEA